MSKSTTQGGATRLACAPARGGVRSRASAPAQRNPFLVAAGLVRAPRGRTGRVFKQPMNPDDEVLP
ncbi:hypothetical protein KTD28_00965 [Burkholderia gladioli]|uniref:hypothetical protein n=1 Tax=Burkholderia gladioli TaxID=28095 RepID=UPI0016418F3A|nr:hypothetical protein [Burkholderia gladioli]MBU9153174.1 hypothetical protein [Burkholderia gladioli]